MHGCLVEAGHFGVSVLAHNQRRVSEHFAGRPDADLQLSFDYIGRTPVLAETAGTIAADILTMHDCGDHSIFIGRVVDLRANVDLPLIVHGGRYASLVYPANVTTGSTIEFL